jgi:LmbE family N-acetylglucosaminyl deacetylase
VRRLVLEGDRPLSVVAIGAHPDDIEIGCGGTLLRLGAEGRLGRVRWAILTGEEPRRTEAAAAARAFLPPGTELELRHAAFTDGYLPASYGEVTRFLHELAAGPAPDVVFTPRREDAHQDHRLLAELAPTVFRDALVLEYEIPKSDGDLGTVNAYVELSAELLAQKVRLLFERFPSQHDRAWFTEETFRALPRLRGIEAVAASGYAEGFVARKVVL